MPNLILVKATILSLVCVALSLGCATGSYRDPGVATGGTIPSPNNLGQYFTIPDLGIFGGNTSKHKTQENEFFSHMSISNWEQYSGLAKPDLFDRDSGGIFESEHWSRYQMYPINLNRLLFVEIFRDKEKYYRTYYLPFIAHTSHSGFTATLKGTSRSTIDLKANKVYGGARVTQDIQVPPASRFAYDMIRIGDWGQGVARNKTVVTDAKDILGGMRSYNNNNPKDLSSYYYHPGIDELPFSPELIGNHIYRTHFTGDKGYIDRVDTGHGPDSTDPADWGVGLDYYLTDPVQVPRSYVLSDQYIRNPATNQVRARVVQAVAPEINAFFGVVFTMDSNSRDFILPEAIIIVPNSRERFQALIGEHHYDTDGYDIFTRKNQWGWYPDGSNDQGELYQGNFGPKGRTGSGLLTNAAGQFYGVFADNEANGPGLLRGNQGERIYGFWRNGILEGWAVRETLDGKRVNQYYKTGVLQETKPYGDAIPKGLPRDFIWVGASPDPWAISTSGRRVLEKARLESGNLAGYFLRDEAGTTTEIMEIAANTQSGTQLKIDGSLYVGSLDFQLNPSGSGQMTFPDGSSLDGIFVAGKPDGVMVYRSTDGQLSERRFVKGQRVYTATEQAESLKKPTDAKTLVENLRKTSQQYLDFFTGTSRQLEEQASQRDLALRLMQYGDDLALLSQKSGGAWGKFLGVTADNMRQMAQNSPEYAQALASYNFQNSLMKGELKPMVELLADTVIEKNPQAATLVNYLRGITLNTLALAEQLRQQRASAESTPTYNAPSKPAKPTTSGTGSAKPQAWKNGHPKPSPEDVQLYAIVAASDHYYQQYLALIRLGKIGEAEKMYQGHSMSVRNAEQLIQLAN